MIREYYTKFDKSKGPAKLIKLTSKAINKCAAKESGDIKVTIAQMSKSEFNSSLTTTSILLGIIFSGLTGVIYYIGNKGQEDLYYNIRVSCGKKGFIIPLKTNGTTEDIANTISIDNLKSYIEPTEAIDRVKIEVNESKPVNS